LISRFIHGQKLVGLRPVKLSKCCVIKVRAGLVYC
jgi:hypothetical protein